MIDLAARVAKDLARPAVLVLDAYYSNSTVFIRASQYKDGEGNQLLHIVTRAKKNCVGFEDPLLKSPGPGRPRKYGEEIKLNELFVTAKDKFKKAEVMLYGKKSKVSYYSVGLIWRPIKSKIRFVLVEYQGNKIIL